MAELGRLVASRPFREIPMQKHLAHDRGGRRNRERLRVDIHAAVAESLRKSRPRSGSASTSEYVESS